VLRRCVLTLRVSPRVSWRPRERASNPDSATHHFETEGPSALGFVVPGSVWAPRAARKIRSDFSCTPPRSRPPSAAPDRPRFSLLRRRRGAESGFLTFYANRPAWFRSLPFRGVLPWTSSFHSYPWLRCHSPHARLPR